MKLLLFLFLLMIFKSLAQTPSLETKLPINQFASAVFGDEVNNFLYMGTYNLLNGVENYYLLYQIPNIENFQLPFPPPLNVTFQIDFLIFLDANNNLGIAASQFYPSSEITYGVINATNNDFSITLQSLNIGTPNIFSVDYDSANSILNFMGYDNSAATWIRILNPFEIGVQLKIQNIDLDSSSNIAGILKVGFWDFNLGIGIFVSDLSSANSTVYKIDYMFSYTFVTVINQTVLPINQVTGVVHDPNRLTAYFFTFTGYVLEFNYGTFTIGTLIQVSDFTNPLINGILDTIRGSAYIGSGLNAGGSFLVLKLAPTLELINNYITETVISSSLMLSRNQAVVAVQGATSGTIILFDLPIPCPGDCNSRGSCDYGVCNCTSTNGNPYGYSGDSCQDWNCPSDCFSAKGQGHCDIFSGNCTCFSGWGGLDCSLRTCPNDCSGNGYCDATLTCTCNLDWSGPSCNIFVPRPCITLTDCNDCSTRPDCGWCDSTKQCYEGNVQGPLEGGCLLWTYQSCPAQGMLFFGYFFSAIAFIFLVIDIYSLLIGDIRKIRGNSDSRVRESWWRNQRSAKEWLLIDQLQFTAITAQFGVNSPTLYETFASIFRWVILGFPLPWSEYPAPSTGRTLSSFVQWSKTILSVPNEILYGNLFWLTLLILFFLIPILVIGLIGILISNATLKGFFKNRITYFFLRLEQFVYFPLAVTACFSLTTGSAGPIIVGLIVLLVIHFGVPIGLFLLMKKKRQDSGSGTGLFDQAFMKKFAPLYSPFYFRRYWFMFPIFLKKLLLGAVIGFSYSAQALQIPLLVIIFVVYIILLFLVRPYLDPLQMVADVTVNILNTIVVILMFAFLEALQISYESQQIIGALIAALLLVSMIVCIAAYIKSWLQLVGIHNFKQLIDKCKGRTSAATYDFADIELNETKTE